MGRRRFGRFEDQGRNTDRNDSKDHNNHVSPTHLTPFLYPTDPDRVVTTVDYWKPLHRFERYETNGVNSLT